MGLSEEELTNSTEVRKPQLNRGDLGLFAYIDVEF